MTFATTHGCSHSRTYNAWKGMKRRCYKPTCKDYPNYGGRGISVCDRWRNSFEAFQADMGECPDDRSLDRFPDVDGNYEPSNCRWATVDEQQQNRRTTKLSMEIAKQIVTLHRAGAGGHKTLGRQFGISRGMVAKIVNGVSWRGATGGA